jgi:hypothetical protein
MKLWLDDVRKPPADEAWVWVMTAEGAIQMLKFGLDGEFVETASLDHDLAPLHYTETYFGDGTGLEVAKFIATMEKPPKEVIVHSWNSVGAMKMLEVLRNAGVPCRYQKAKSFP